MTETVNTSTGELVTVDPSSEVAVTSYLQQARDWLATAVETTGPEQIARAKAEIATAAEATKQLHLSKEIQDDAREMVRRAEYALGKAIRKGQADGSIESKSEATRRAVAQREVQAGRSDQSVVDTLIKPKPTDFGSHTELYKTNAEGILGLLSEASESEFEDALKAARAEGNLSRANVVRKVKGYVAGDLATRDQRAEAIHLLAEKGWASRQMTERIGITEDAIRRIARDYGIGIPADRVLNKQRRVNPNDIVENLVIGLEGSVMSLDLVDLSDLDRESAEFWATSLTESLQKLNRFAKQIKEIAHVQS